RPHRAGAQPHVEAGFCDRGLLEEDRRRGARHRQRGGGICHQRRGARRGRALDRRLRRIANGLFRSDGGRFRAGTAQARGSCTCNPPRLRVASIRRGVRASMPIQVLMPALSPTMEKGNLAKWHKKEGDAVKSGDVIAEIETDKATMEVEAVDEGTLGRILVPEGTNDVAVNTPIAMLLAEGEDAAALKDGAKDGGKPARQQK